MESLCYVTGTIVVLFINYISKRKTNKLRNKKRSDLWLQEVGVGGGLDKSS